MKLLICRNHQKQWKIRHFKGTTYIVIVLGRMGIYFWYKTNKIQSAKELENV